MYIGTNLNVLKGINSKMDILSFTFDISKKSIPLLDKYGFDIDINTFMIEDVLSISIPDIIEKLEDESIRYKSFDLDKKLKKVNINLEVSGLTTSKLVDI